MIRIDLALGLGDELTLLQLTETSEPPRVDGGIYFFSAPTSGEPLGRWAQYFADSTETVSSNIKYPKDLAGDDITDQGRWHFFQAGTTAADVLAIVETLIEDAITSANEYTDDEIATVTVTLQDYTDSEITGVVSYIDSQLTSKASISYVNSQVSSGLATANSYTDSGLASNAAASNAYADAAETDAKNFATAADVTVLATATAQDATNLALTDRIIVNAYRITTSQTLTDGAYNTLIWNSAPVNVGSVYNTTTGIFTPIATKFYEFEFGLAFETDGVNPINFVGALFEGANAVYQLSQQASSPGLSGFRMQPFTIKWPCTSGTQYSLRQLTQVASETFLRFPHANPQHFTKLTISECRS